MTLTNHLLTGAVLAKFLPLPAAISIAFASHFLLDALPHFGYDKAEGQDVLRRHRGAFGSVISLDIVVALLVSIWLIQTHHLSWFLVGLVAYSPDLLWIYRFTVEEKFGKLRPTKGNRFIQFHREIQKYERVWGGWVELAYATTIFLLLK